ncbi:MAG: hydrogenase maturation protease [Pseudonocardiaceae bacterium]
MLAATKPDGQADEPSGPGCEVLVIGCGNLLRGDDGAGPRLVRLLWDTPLPGGVRLVDGGTAGMDVAFQMRGARRVVLVDASHTGAEPGTVYRVPGPDLEELPRLKSMHSHSFRWDHALALGRWLLKDAYPDDITVFLIEARCVDLGTEITPPVRAGMAEVMSLIEADWVAPLRPGAAAGTPVPLRITPGPETCPP